LHKEIRLNQWIAKQGIASRRKADDLIAQRQVLVNGKIATLGAKIAAADKVEIVGHRTEPKPVLFRYFAFHKPYGYLSSRQKQGDSDTIFDYLIKHEFDATGMQLAGRLDRDSVGLMILSNDGDLIFRLTHPSFEVTKQYEVWVQDAFNPADKKVLEQGLEVDGEHLACDRVVMKKFDGKKSRLQIWLHEGKKRHLRRLLTAAGYHVIQLKRMQIGPLKLGTLVPGAYRPLTRDEIQSLHKAVRFKER
jgi:23S rRNA pseudouridine2605 synthase